MSDAPPASHMSGEAEGLLSGSRRRTLDRALRTALPLLVLAGVIYLWDWTVRANEIPPYILPSPGLVVETLIEERGLLLPSLATTLAVTLAALVLAVIGGVLLAIVLTQSRIIEYSIFPIAVVVQVTPIVAVFPLINIYIDNLLAKILLCAWIIAFFPILSNTTLGLMSADRNLRDLYRLYGASRWQTLRHLLLPAALPYFLGGLRISGGLALVGAVVAEFVAGTSGFGSGLATRIIEAGYQLKIPRLFAALGLISLTGVAIYVILSIVSNLILGRWHESAMEDRR